MKIIEHNDSRGAIVDGLDPYYGEYDGILDILDFPLESLGDDTLTDWDASNSQHLGPIPLDAFMGFYQTNTGNESVIKAPCHDRNALLKTTSNMSIVSRGRARSKRGRPSNVNQRFMKTPIACAGSVGKKSSNSSKAKKRPRTSELSNAPEGLPEDLKHTENKATSMQRSVGTRSCTHCNVRKTPQWREGPLGKHTLCNACGVRYRSGCLFPEYRPAASPTFNPLLHSNSKAKKRPRTSELPNAPEGPRISLQQAMMGLPEGLNHTEKKVTYMQRSIGTRICTQCNVTKTPLWREGPLGKNTLCNACGIRYHSGNLLPEYRPAASPTFTPSLHSNSIKAEKRPRTSELPNAPEGPIVSLQNSMMRPPEDLHHAEKNVTSMHRSVGTKRCAHCNVTKTPQWREGPLPCAGSVAKKSSNNIIVKMRIRTSELPNAPEGIPSELSNAREGIPSELPNAPVGIPSELSNAPVGIPSELSNAREGIPGDLNHSEKKATSMKRSVGTRSCTHCKVTKTPQWREGPLGGKTLCNACGVRYRTGRLFPEYRPAASPTFTPSLHSNSHKEVIKMRKNAIHEAVLVENPISWQEEFVPTSKLYDDSMLKKW